MISTDAQRALMNSVCHTNHLLIRDSLLENIVLHQDFLCAYRGLLSQKTKVLLDLQH